MVLEQAGIQAGEMIWHAIKRTISVICVLLVIGGIIFAVYIAFVKPNFNPLKTTSQRAEQIINPTNAPHATFGCASLRVYEYYARQKDKNNAKEKTLPKVSTQDGVPKKSK